MRKVLKRFLFIADCDDWLYRSLVYKKLPPAPTGFYWTIQKDAPHKWSQLHKEYPKACYVHVELMED